jgi:hypothetical protein
MKTLKLKEEVLITVDSRQSVRCHYRNVRIHRKRRWRRGYLLKKREEKVLMSSTLKGVGTGLFRTTIIAWNWNRSRSRAVVELFDHLSPRK